MNKLVAILCLVFGTIFSIVGLIGVIQSTLLILATFGLDIIHIIPKGANNLEILRLYIFYLGGTFICFVAANGCFQ